MHAFFFFWFLVDVAIDNAFILEGWVHRDRGLPKWDNKSFCKELATELIGMHYGRLLADHPMLLGFMRDILWFP